MVKKYRTLPVKDVANFYHSTNKEIIENCVLLEKEGVKKECVLAKIAVQGRVNTCRENRGVIWINHCMSNTILKRYYMVTLSKLYLMTILQFSFNMI